MVVFAIHSHESAMGVQAFPILNSPRQPASPSHPSELPQCTSPEHPVPCIEPGLVIYFTYDNIYVSMVFSQIIPLSPSNTTVKSYVSGHFFFFCRYWKMFNHSLNLITCDWYIHIFYFLLIPSWKVIIFLEFVYFS